MDDLAARLAELPAQTESGLWQRHVAAAAINHALEGRSANGRWGTRGGFPVLYIGRPTESVIVEAYRHLVDPVEVDTPQERETLIANLTPRVLVTCHVQVTELLDLRTALARANAGVTMQDLESNTEDTHAYARCQQVAQTAHQLGRHGIIAPAATGLGDTLVLFMDILPSAERPARSSRDTPWPQLPPDPRVPAQVACVQCPLCLRVRRRVTRELARRSTLSIHADPIGDADIGSQQGLPGVPAETRLLRYGIGRDAFGAHRMLANLGLLHVESVARWPDGRARDHGDEGAFLHRLRLLPGGFQRDAGAHLADVLDGLLSTLQP